MGSASTTKNTMPLNFYATIDWTYYLISFASNLSDYPIFPSINPIFQSSRLLIIKAYAKVSTRFEMR